LPRKVQVVQMLARDLRHKCTTTRHNGHQTFGFQAFERLPNRNQANVQIFSKLILIDAAARG
jgi:hypothetical protein